MTKKEFEDRTGVQISDELFESINIIYMNAGDNIDKDTFCKDYKKHADSKILHALHDRVVMLQKECKRLSNDKRTIAITLIREAAASKSGVLREHVRGEKRCVSGRDERGLGDWFGGQGVGRGLVVGGGKTKRFTGVKRSWQTVCT